MTARFEDWLAIVETKARYCRCVDTQDWQGFADCFTEDGVLDLSGAGGSCLEGRRVVTDTVSRSVTGARTAHHVHNPEIRFAGDGADVIWAMQDRVEWSEAQAAAMDVLGHTGYGHYRERYEKCADHRWRIARSALSYVHFDVRRRSDGG